MRLNSFVILDDTSYMAPHMVLVDEAVGPTEADADPAIVMPASESR